MYDVQVRQCEATLRSGGVLTSNSLGLMVRFTFSQEWEKLTKLCVFRAGDTRVDVLLEGDSCSIPEELLRHSDCRLFVGVRGTDEAGELILASTYVNLGTIMEGTFPSGAEPESYTPALVDQVLAAAGQAAQSAATAAVQALEQCLLERRLDALLAAATLWDTRSGNPVLLQDAAAGIPLRTLRVETGFLDGGTDRLTLRWTGKNLWNSESFLEASGWERTEDGGYTGHAARLRARFQDSAGGLFGNNLGWDRQVTVSFEASTEYDSGNRLSVYISYADGSTATVSQNVNGTARTRYTVTSKPGKTIRSIFLSYGSDSVLRLYNFQVEFGAEATSFEPYRETSYTAILPEPVYGGTLELAEGRFTPRFDAEGQESVQPALSLEPQEILLPAGDSVLFSDCGSVSVVYCQNAALVLARLQGAA